MLFYRLALQKILQSLKLDEFFMDDQRAAPRPTTSKRLHKTLLHLDQKMDIYVSILLSVISMLICLTIPIVALEKPCQIFKENNMDFLYAVASWIEQHLILIDRLIVALSLILAGVSAKMVIDGILGTNISLSPWRERGKYYLPKGFRWR